MTDTPDTLLRDLARHLRGENALASHDAERVADAIDAVLQGDRDGLDQAIGLTGSWRTEAARRRRDQLYRSAAHEHYRGQPVSGQAQALAAAIRRYAADAWPRDQHRDTCPPRHSGTVQEYVFAAFQECGPDTANVAWRQLHEILKAK
jgi:hypothetical protein